MAAFERVECGIEGLDAAFDNIRLGDNVVWQLDELEDFRVFTIPFADAALSRGKTIHYMRFAGHEPVLDEQPGIVVHQFNPHEGFEAFTVAVRNVITEQGREALYVFDCLSELQAAWSADMMMGNFFRLTCPYLFSLDTVAYFPVLRGRHSFAAIAKIRDTTQVLIDVYRDVAPAYFDRMSGGHVVAMASGGLVSTPGGYAAAPGAYGLPAFDGYGAPGGFSARTVPGKEIPRFRSAMPPSAQDDEHIGVAMATGAANAVPVEPEAFFIHPLKVWNRYSDTMFLAHRFVCATGQVKVCTNGVDAARFYSLMSKADMSGTDRNIDSWDRFFADAQRAYATGTLTDATCARMCNMMMTKDPRMRSMVRRYFDPEDYFAVRNRMVGTGLVGGKACGMLLAQKIVATCLPQHTRLIEPHDSFYLGTDVFYSYIVANGLWELRIAQRQEDGFISAAPPLREGLLSGSFPDDIRERFRRILEYYGQSPIIVRSSSFLEDGFGNAFAGKYESVFCANVGSPEDRLVAFEDAVRTVYASTMDPSALEYRLRNDLHKREEQMALLVQRVSGSHYGAAQGKNLFMPTAAGVGYSHAAYRFLRDVDPSAGMLRLVVGLGTRAVDRTESDYPRIVSLDKPRVTAARTTAEKHRYSQHYADLLDLGAGCLAERNVQELIGVLPDYCKRVLFEHDREAERLFSDRGHRRNVLFASCEGLAAMPEFTGLMGDILRTLHAAYDGAVDIEFTVNIGEEGGFTVNLLQCRPLSMMAPGERVEVPALPGDDVFFAVHGEAMGASRKMRVQALCVVDPKAYYLCAHALKPSVAQLVGQAGEWLEEQGIRGALLLSPGRIGTSSPELGVPVSFAQIAKFKGVCEVAYSAVGYAPELSYGSHMFQDLVEADIYYAALLEDARKAVYDPAFVHRLHEVPLAEWGGCGQDGLEGIVRVYDARDAGLTLWHDHVRNESVCGLCEI